MVRAAAKVRCSQSTSGAAEIEEGQVSHKKSFVVVMVALSAVVLAGVVSVSLSAREPVGYSPNHHPRSVNG
jgi:hypothetical protein